MKLLRKVANLLRKLLKFGEDTGLFSERPQSGSKNV